MNQARGVTTRGPRTPTITDGDAMKAALLEYLRGESGASLEDRALLVRMTEPATSWLDADGMLRVGAWLFDDGGGAPTLRYRLPPTKDMLRFYVASLAYEQNTWKVVRIQHERVRAAGA